MEKTNKSILNNSKGITLISLVLTIIILLILASVSIGILAGEDGLLEKATNAKEENRIAVILEEWNLLKMEILMSKITDDTIINKNQIASRLSDVGMTPSEIDSLITKEGTIVLNSKTTLNYSDLGLEISETVTTEGKTAIFLGDSVAYGYSTNGNGFGYYINKTANFSNFTNAAKNTATINTSTQGNNNIIEQIKNNKDNQYDFVIIEGGYGDLRDTPTLGSLTDGYKISEYDTTTFAGAVEYSLYLATTYWPNARIGFIISYDTPNSNYGVRPNHSETKKYWDIVKSACNKWNVQYLDFFEGSTYYNNEIKTYSELFDVTSNTYLESDNIHPTANGYEFICPFILDWIKTLKVYKSDFEIDTSTNSSSQITEFTQLTFYKQVSIQR